MKKFFIFLFLVIFSTMAMAQPVPGRLNITEEDGSPSTFPYKLKVTNGTLTNNNDGTASLSISGSSSGDAAADGVTKGIATFTAADFDSSSGLISIDYTNGQAATGSVKGFLTAADWMTFNNKGTGTVNTGVARAFAYYPASNTTVDDSAVGFTDGTNVGLGTSAPRTFLEIQGTVSIIHGGGNAGRLGIGNTAPTAKLDVSATGSSTAALALNVGSASLTVLNSGMVGIGTSTVSANAILAIGSANAMLITGTGSITRMGGSTVSVDNNQFNLNGTNVTINNTGSAAGSNTIVTGGANASSHVDLRSTSTTGSGDYISFKTGLSGGREIGRIISSGAVGIGTTAPEAILEVQASESVDAVIDLDADDGDDAADTWFLKSVAADNNLNFVNDTNNRVTFTSGGLVGIGTTAPAGTLTVVGHIHTKGTAPTVATNDCGSTSQGAIVTKSTDNSGSVTVGTVAPTSCAITFATTWTNAPNCVAVDDSNILAVKALATTTKLTISAVGSLQGDVLTWICQGNE